jgi:hypothetical protein
MHFHFCSSLEHPSNKHQDFHAFLILALADGELCGTSPVSFTYFLLLTREMRNLLQDSAKFSAQDPIQKNLILFSGGGPRLYFFSVKRNEWNKC